MIHFNHILQSTPRLNSLSLPFTFPHCQSLLPHSYFMPSPQQLLDVLPRVSSTNHEAPHNAISSTVLALPPSYAQLSPQHPIPTHPLPKFSLNVIGEVPHSFKSHIKLEFCALSSSHFQISDGRLRTEIQQATTKRDTTCPLSRKTLDARRQNLCVQLFTFSPPLRYFNLEKTFPYQIW